MATPNGATLDKPNIVFIMADQLGARLLGCYGSGVDSSPTLDRLSSAGVRFDRFYATSPVCAPNRATILTGRSPEIHGIVTNNYALPHDMPTFLDLLRAQGYRTGGFGKFHQTPMSWRPASSLGFLGFDESIVTEDPKWGPWIDWVRENHPAWYGAAIAMTNGHSGSLGVFPEREAKQGASSEQVRIKLEEYPRVMERRRKMSAWERMYPSPLPADVHDTTFITDLGLDFIQRTTRDTQQPFFCYISYVDPHDPYDPPEPYASLYSAKDMPDPIPAEWHAESPPVLDRVLDSYLRFRAIHDTPDAIRQLRALYHGSLRYLDDQIARVASYLQEHDLWEHTILVFATDHGDMLGDHGLIAKGIPHYDTGIRCPLLVCGGGVVRRVSDRLCCSLDLYPTFCDLAGVPEEARPPIEGRSLTNTLLSYDATDDRMGWQEVAVSFSEADSVITADGWRLTRYSQSGYGQLFHLASDPLEQRNLYTNPAFAGKRIELLERLVKVRMLPRSVPQYRNMPLDDGARHYVPDAGKQPIPAYTLPISPWLVAGHRPEWNAS